MGPTMCAEQCGRVHREFGRLRSTVESPWVEGLVAGAATAPPSTPLPWGVLDWPLRRDGGAGPSSAAAPASLPSSGSSASSDSNHPKPHPDVTDLVRGADQARCWYAAATVEVERLKNSLAAMEVALKEADAETADALARVAGLE
ncbi:uncharacterized protein LOC120697460 [Panicum virgatum]|uniref:uncharacterized protein LOC120697460 n=1 Tax=Panicum virgatum TaxID=38727 RepID=UPI0019D53919|nr:uncharacterized protein LOC120697460 [Panicum virgatum]